MDIYQSQIMDHYRNPRKKGVCSPASFSSDVVNPSCGDSVTITGTVVEGLVTCLRFEGAGCVISQAAASLLCNYAEGKTITELTALSARDMLALVGIALGPMRARCALLALEALQKGVLSA